MSSKWIVLAVPAAFCVLAAEEPAWQTRQIPDWTTDDAQQILSDSPWTKTVSPSLSRQGNGGPPGGGRRGGIGLGGVGIGFPGGGIGRRGGGYPGGRTGTDDGGQSTPPSLKLRWESALPVREAELKARDVSAPTLDPDHYAIAVYGIPARFASPDAKALPDQLKKQAALRRDGKKDIKPSSVEVLQREEGPVIVYLFPRAKEITRDDRRIEFDAHVGRLEFTGSFYPEEMTYQGKLEL